MSALDIESLEIPSEVGLGKSKKKKKAAAAKETKEGKSHKGKGHHHHKKFVPSKGWKAKCHKDKAWCDKFLEKYVLNGQASTLFAGKKRIKIQEKDSDQMDKECRRKVGLRKPEDYEKASQQQHKKFFLCFNANLVYAELFGLKHAKKMARGGNLADGEASGSLTIWFAMGVMLLLVFASIGAYFALLRGKKGKDTLGKGSTKLGKLKSRRSGKSAKSARMSSRKSAKQSAKRSVSGKSRASRGTKKSTHKK